MIYRQILLFVQRKRIFQFLQHRIKLPKYNSLAKSLRKSADDATQILLGMQVHVNECSSLN